MAWSGFLDFCKLENNMISGLTESQIQEVSDNDDSPSFGDSSFLDDFLNAELSPPISPCTSSGLPAPLSNNEILALNNSTMSEKTNKGNKWSMKLSGMAVVTLR